MQIPLENPEGNCEGPQGGRQKREESNQQAFLQVGPKRIRVNFRARQERQQNTSNARQEIDPVIGSEMKEIAGQNANTDLDQGDGNAYPNRDHGCDQRQTNPQRSSQPDIHSHLII